MTSRLGIFILVDDSKTENILSLWMNAMLGILIPMDDSKVGNIDP
jgi:hypothetical protein